MAYLLAKDTVNGAEGKVFVKINGQNIEVAGMKKIQANAEIQGEDMRVIGTRKIQNKPNGAKLTGSGTIYYGSTLFTNMVLEYIQTGIMPQFDIQITNSDSATTLGNQVAAYYGCQLTGTIPISILDDEQSMLNYEFNWTYTNVQLLTSFNSPAQLGSN